MTDEEAKLRRVAAADQPWWLFADLLRSAMDSPGAFGCASDRAVLERAAEIRNVSVSAIKKVLDARSAADRSGLDVYSDGFAASPKLVLLFRRVFVFDRQRAAEFRTQVQKGEVPTTRLDREIQALRARGAKPQPDAIPIASARGRAREFTRSVGATLPLEIEKSFGSDAELRPVPFGSNIPFDYEVLQEGSFKAGIAIRSGKAGRAGSKLFDMFAPIKLFALVYPTAWLVLPSDWRGTDLDWVKFFNQYFGKSGWNLRNIEIYTYDCNNGVYSLQGGTSSTSYLGKYREFIKRR